MADFISRGRKKSTQKRDSYYLKVYLIHQSITVQRELYYNRVRLCLQTALVQENSRGNDRKGKRMSEDPHAEIIKSFQKFKVCLMHSLSMFPG